MRRVFTATIEFTTGSINATSTLTINDTKHSGFAELAFDFMAINFSGTWFKKSAAQNSFLRVNAFPPMTNSSGLGYKWNEFDIDVAATLKQRSTRADAQKEAAAFVLTGIATNWLRNVVATNEDAFIGKLDAAFP